MSIKQDILPYYTSFFSDKAIELAKWSIREMNRIKARKIHEAACRMEYRYRKTNIGITDPEFKVWRGRYCSQHAQVPIAWDR